MYRKSVFTAIAMVTMAVTGCSAAPSPNDPCVTTTTLDGPTMQGRDKARGNAPITLYPVEIRYGKHGKPKAITTSNGLTIGLPDVPDNPLKLYLPADGYVFTGDWLDGACKSLVIVGPPTHPA